MTVVLAVLVLSAAVSAALWGASRSLFEAPVFQRENYRAVSLPVGVGILAVLAAVAVEAGLDLADLTGRDPSALERAGRAAVVLGAIGFGLLGLLDDLAAQGTDRGFRGHIRSMIRGRLTTGAVKLLGGGVLAVLVVTTAGADSWTEVAIGAPLVALAANLGNLFDRAPGRTIKVALLAGVVLAASSSAGDRPALVGPALVLGAGLGLLAFDVRERLMLGDAGANALGAALGVGVVMTSGVVVQGVVLASLVALNVASEVVSFSSVIDRVPPLRVVDRMGRRPDPA